MCRTTDLLLAGILQGRREPLSPHHCGAIRERLNDMTNEEVDDFVLTGLYQTNPKSGKKEGWK